MTVAAKTIFDDVELLKKELVRCMKCGNCMSVCPIYSVEKKESSVARGKIALGEAVLSDDIKIDDETLVKLIFNCLVCKSCMLACPSGVRFDRIILGLRAAIAKKKGIHFIKKALFGLLKKPELFDKGMKAFAAMQGLFLSPEEQGKRAPRGFLKGVSPRFDEKFIIPELTKESFRDRVKEKEEVPQAQAKALFFTGCSVNYLYPEVGDDLIYVLKRNKVSVVTPKKQNCCGMPVMVHGDIETARELAQKNLEVFEKTGADYIITVCGSCGSALKHEYPIILEGTDYEEKAKKWVERVHDISTFLLKVIRFESPKGNLNLKVTYHDSCHLKKSMKVFNEPRQILKTIPGLTLIDMKKPDACCGSGGSFHLTHADTALKIVKSKTEDIKGTEAEIVCTGCPACMMELFEGIKRFGGNCNVTHTVSLLAESYRSEQKS
ncbi:MULTISPECIES: (Fe-S)-binding protein [Thermodesulfovibrio]|uniref:(Fe-S)-binding protein n=1 Tax=Thermodesulfovibrio TaxID=28261 RepID=UPI002622DA86|nr:(Fe-S)-binding protein [Thermodesulfovibrio sp.]